MTTIAVTGATGQLGRLVVAALLDRGVPAPNIIAAVRSPEKAADLAAHGVRVRHVDYAQPDTLAPALEGAERLLLISGTPGDRVAQHAEGQYVWRRTTPSRSRVGNRATGPYVAEGGRRSRPRAGPRRSAAPPDSFPRTARERESGTTAGTSRVFWTDETVRQEN